MFTFIFCAAIKVYNTLWSNTLVILKLQTLIVLDPIPILPNYRCCFHRNIPPAIITLVVHSTVAQHAPLNLKASNCNSKFLMWSFSLGKYQPVKVEVEILCIKSMRSCIFKNANVTRMLKYIIELFLKLVSHKLLVHLKSI